MKKIFALVLVALFVWSSVAIANRDIRAEAAQQRGTFTGVIKNTPDPQFDDVTYEIITGDKDFKTWLTADDIKHTTKEFRQCVGNFKYKGKLSITAKFQPEVTNQFLYLDKTSTCKRR